MKAAARRALQEGIALFNAGKFEDAALRFKASLAAGGGKEAAFCLEHVRKSLAPQPVAAPAGAPAVERRLRERAAARDYAAVFAQLDALFEHDLNFGYRLARDYWLSGELGDLAGRANDTAWDGFFLSSAAWRHGDDAGALRLLDAASRASGRVRWMRYYLAEILLRRRDFFALARAEVEETLRDCPWLWEARCLRAEILLAMGSEKGLDALTRLKVPAASEPAFLAWRGAQRMWAGRAAEAVVDLDAAALRANPDALCWRGGARVLLGRLKPALEDLDRLLKIDPKDPEALVWRGEARRKAGLRGPARKDLDRAIALYPDSTWAFVNRALLRLDEGDLEGAREDFARLAPPTYADAPDGSRKAAYTFARVPLSAAKLKTLLKSALTLARGCRRADSHLNVGWMKAAGIAVPRRPAPHSRLLYWLRWKGLPTPPELVFGPGTMSEDDARRACGRPTAGAKGGASSHSVPA